jgi:hypothetical protein
MTTPVVLAQDRTLAVPKGMLIRTAYVKVEDITLACKDRMSVGDVERAYNKRLQLGGELQPWPCPCGKWEGNRFAIYDGRHEYIAAVMLGTAEILVAWIEPGQAAGLDPRAMDPLVQLETLI